MADRLLRSSLEVEVRSIDETKRQATFVASTENPVRGWGDPEVLRMDGAKLERYRKNPVLLDSHNRWGLDSVIGSCEVEVKARKLIAVASYADTERGENAWKLVKGGHVRAMSIGYSVNPKKVTRLGEGSTDGEGASRVKGPASIVNEWELLEISNVPVPADEDAVRRSFYEGIPEHEEATMADKNVPTGSLISRAMHGAAPSGSLPPELGTEIQTPAPTRAANAEELSGERYAREEEARTRAILARAPKGSALHETALGFVAQGLDVKTAHERLMAAQAERFKPVSTPEPAAIEKPKAAGEQRAADLPGEVTDDVLLRSLEGLTG